MNSIFLSYARSDDEPFVCKLYSDLMARGFDVWFDRVSMPSRRLTFHQEIRDAIAARDRLLLVIGPGVRESEYVRQEWQFAWLEAEKVVTPIVRLNGVDDRDEAIDGYELIPDELKLVHNEDFRDDAEYETHLEQLDRILRAPPPPLGKLIGVPSLPPYFLSRGEGLQKLRDALRADLDGPDVIGGYAAKAAVHGMGGIGKSVLGSALVRDRKLREAFPDGIVWVGIGTSPDLAERMREVHRALGGDGGFATEFEGKARLTELLADKAVFLVLDDVWRRTDADAFDVLGPRCRALLTTRDVGLATSFGSIQYMVDLFTEQEAIRLLTVAADLEGEQLPLAAHDVLGECGKLPLAIALAGGMVRAGISWHDLRDAMREHELEFLEEPHAGNEHHVNLWRMIEVSVRALDIEVQQRLAELAVFPEGEAVPNAAVCTLWRHTANLSPRHAHKLLVELKQRSLVQLSRNPTESAEAGGAVWLHDLIYDYCAQRSVQMFGDATSLHTKLLGAYRAVCPDGWWAGPNDGYFFEHLRTHLVAASASGELTDLVRELRWLEAKNGAGLVFDLVADYLTAIDALPQPDTQRRILKLLVEALRRDIHFIHRHRDNYPQALFQCMWNYAWWYDCPEAAQHYVSGKAPGANEPLNLYKLLERWRMEKEANGLGPWLRTLRPPAVHLNSPLIAVFNGHEQAVNSVCFSPDGRRVVSGSTDGTVRVWDVESGKQQVCLEGHEKTVCSVSCSPDGRKIASGSEDYSVRIWDFENSTDSMVLRGHTDHVTSVSFFSNSRQIASRSINETVWVWDVKSGTGQAVRGELIGTVSSFSSNGQKIATGSNWDDLARVWNIQSCSEPIVLEGHRGYVLSIAFSPDGTLIASGSLDNTVRVWDAANGACLDVIEGCELGVDCIVFAPDNQRLASGSATTVRIWDIKSKAELALFRGHEHRITSISFSPDGRQVVSGSVDKTIRLWSAETNAEQAVLQGHKYPISSISISMESQRIATGANDSTARIWDAECGIEFAIIEGYQTLFPALVCLSPDGRRIVTAFGKLVQVQDVESGTDVAVLDEHEFLVTTLAFSPDGRRIATGSVDHTVRVWNPENNTAAIFRGENKSQVNCVTFSPDGLWIASGNCDSTIRVWDIENQVQLFVLRGHKYGVSSIGFSPDGQRIVSRSEDGMVRIWDIKSRTCVNVIEGCNEEAAVIAGGISRFPWRAIVHRIETVVLAACNGLATAYFPEAFIHLATYPSGLQWAATNGKHLQLLQLEGVPERI